MNLTASWQNGCNRIRPEPYICVSNSGYEKDTISFHISCFAKAVLSQELAQVSFSGGNSLTYLSLLTDGNVQIRISPDGKILEWGTEEQSPAWRKLLCSQVAALSRPGGLLRSEADSVSRGKVKTIGSSVVTHFSAYETAERVGKIRSVGRLFFDYYSTYDNKLFQGKIKSIGNLPLVIIQHLKMKPCGKTEISW